MARKQSENGAPASKVSVIPDFTGPRGASSGLFLRSYAVRDTASEGKVLDLVLELEASLAPENWPPLLAALRSPVVEGMMTGGHAFDATRQPMVTGHMQFAGVTNGVTDDPIMDKATATLRRVKVAAKEDQLRIRWTFRVAPQTRYMGPLFDCLGADVEVKFSPAQQSLPTRPRTVDLAES